MDSGRGGEDQLTAGPSETRPPGNPRFSVIIPTHRRPARLAAALDGLASAAYASEAFEVIVVDDGSRDDTAGIVDRFVQRLQVSCLVCDVQRGPAAARNRGAAAARGTLLAFLDDDCVPAPDWLARLDAAFLRSSDAPLAFGGRTVVAQANSLFGTASQLLVDFLYEWYNGDGEHSTFFATNNFACRREDFLAIGGFDESFRWAAAEDRDFCDRWIECGWRLAFVADAIVHHSQRTDLTGFLRQQAGYGRGAVDLHAARDRRGVARPRLEPLGFYWRLVTYPFGRAPLLHAVSLILLTATSQVAYAWGFFSERWHRSRHASARNA